MFSNEKIQDLLISPTKSLNRKELIENYNNRDFIFSEKDISELAGFLDSIKSPKVCEQIIENKFFQRIVPLLYEKQIPKSFFGNVDVVKLFYNIIDDKEIFNTRRPRRKNVIEVFNKVSNHILLSDDYEKIIYDGEKFIQSKMWKFQDGGMVLIDDRTLSLFTKPMLDKLLEYENIDDESIKNYFKKDILSNLASNNYDFNKVFSHLLTGDYKCFKGTDYIYFSVITEKIENNQELKERFISFIYNILCNNQNFDLTEENMVKKVLYSKMKNMRIRKEQYKDLFSSADV